MTTLDTIMIEAHSAADRMIAQLDIALALGEARRAAQGRPTAALPSELPSTGSQAHRQVAPASKLSFADAIGLYDGEGRVEANLYGTPVSVVTWLADGRVELIPGDMVKIAMEMADWMDELGSTERFSVRMADCRDLD